VTLGPLRRPPAKLEPVADEPVEAEELNPEGES
jgi:hypothetical protein